MKTNYTRKKQPEIVKAQLLNAAAEITVEKGLSEITLDEVARRAGVSKGGLLHHFSNRRLLIEALFCELLRRFDAKIEDFINLDPEPKGRFSRAYLLAITAPNNDAFENKLVGSAMLAMSMDASLAAVWRQWLSEQLEKHGEKEASVAGQIVRFAADGIWVENSISESAIDVERRAAAISRLLELSKEI